MSKILHNNYVLAVPDARISADYFLETLGFSQFLDLGGWVFVERDGCMIRLGSCPGAIAPSDLGDHSYFAYFVVDDVDGYYEEISEKGANSFGPPQDMEWGMREFGLATVDGHRIMIGQRIGE
jgi:hypothetical protein